MWRGGRISPRADVCADRSANLHGPYWHWSTKVNGKTVNRRVNDREAALYNQWIDNDRQARELLAKMREVAAKAASLIIREEAG